MVALELRRLVARDVHKCIPVKDILLLPDSDYITWAPSIPWCLSLRPHRVLLEEAEGEHVRIEQCSHSSRHTFCFELVANVRGKMRRASVIALCAVAVFRSGRPPTSTPGAHQRLDLVQTAQPMNLSFAAKKVGGIDITLNKFPVLRPHFPECLQPSLVSGRVSIGTQTRPCNFCSDTHSRSILVVLDGCVDSGTDIARSH